jgi:hypothetical protein
MTAESAGEPYARRSRGQQVRRLHLGTAPEDESPIEELRRLLDERTAQLELAVTAGRQQKLTHRRAVAKLRRELKELRRLHR